MLKLFLRVEHDQALLLEHPIPYVLLKAKYIGKSLFIKLPIYPIKYKFQNERNI